jgi:subtilisin family serine protease
MHCKNISLIIRKFSQMTRTILRNGAVYAVLCIIPLCTRAGTGNNFSASPKLQHDLRTFAESVHASSGTSAQAFGDTITAYAKALHLMTVANNVFVEFFASDTAAINDAFLAKYGIAHDSYFGRIKNRVQAMVPATQLNKLAEDSAVNWVQPPDHAHAEVISQGVTLTYANTYHNHVPAYIGSGVKVAVIDLGFYGYQNLLGSDLPSTVVAKSFRSDGDITGGGEDHGTACAEVVHDMAPGAQLYLINFYTINDLTNALYYCLDSNIQIITHSIGWTNLSFYDGTGPISQIVNNADASGILWCTAAGNDAQGHWDGTFSDPDGNGWENFSGTDESILVNLTANNQFQLDMTWDQWPLATSDYDLYLYNDAGGVASQIVASSTNIQAGLQPPSEEIVYTPTQSGVYHIKIKRKSGAAAKLALFSYETPFADYNVAARSLVEPGDASGAFTVGAVGVSSPTTIEGYSGQGPTEDGRMKPDISGPDCNASDVYGVFCGTSSATPHTAGAAALLLSQNSSLTNTQLKSILTRNAQDLGTPGADDIFGAGLLRMPDITPPSTPIINYSFDTAKSSSHTSSTIFTWQSTDSWSGVAGYSYVIDNSASTQPPNILMTANDSVEMLLDNSKGWYCHVISVDSAGNWSAVADLGPLLLHTLAVNEAFAPGQMNINVYPNPANSVTTLALSGSPAMPVHVQLYDMLGRSISSFNMTADNNGYSQTMLDVHDLPGGMYEVRAMTSAKTFSASLLVTK